MLTTSQHDFNEDDKGRIFLLKSLRSCLKIRYPQRRETSKLRSLQPSHFAARTRQSALLSLDIRATPPLRVSSSVTALFPLTFLALRPPPSCLHISASPFAFFFIDRFRSSSLFRLQQRTPGFRHAAAERRIDPSLAT
ncbi:hypothetical protein HN51_048986, partial [Arachis hypogaea]